MSGLLRRLRRARDSAHPDAHPAGEDVTGVYAGEHADAWSTDTRTGEAGTGETGPAGLPEERKGLDALVGSPPTARRRSRLRRRLRHLRRVRELLLRDLGGFVLELHRTEATGDHSEIVDAKLRRLAAVDTEIRQLEDLLDDRRPLVVREPGIGGACPQCGELFGSEARFCWACGTPVAAGAGAIPLFAAVSVERRLTAGADAPAEPPAEQATGPAEPPAEPATGPDAPAEPPADAPAEPPARVAGSSPPDPAEQPTDVLPEEADREEKRP